MRVLVNTQGPLMLADPERVDLALRIWRRMRRHSERPQHPAWLARQPDWQDSMDGFERHQLLAMSEVDLLAFDVVVDAETCLVEALVELADEPAMRTLIEQHRPKRGGP
jgi:hypothetical protein